MKEERERDKFKKKKHIHPTNDCTDCTDCTDVHQEEKKQKGVLVPKIDEKM